ncbi:MAG: DUF4824 family protein [Gemmatimonadota bacterium]|jgi:hypothetical protein|nr:DUF4824 family protein [Gemmatimonadota bacterium]
MRPGVLAALGIVVVATLTGIVSGVRSQNGTGGLWLRVGRDLRLQTGDPENTERALQWVVRRGERNRITLPGRTPADLGLGPDDGDQALARPRFVVLTLLDQATAADSSRLAAVDAGPDLAALAARYPDRDRHLIVRGTIARWKPDSLGGVSFYLSLSPGQLHLPTELPLGRELLVRSGRGAIPFIAQSRP